MLCKLKCILCVFLISILCSYSYSQTCEDGTAAYATGGASDYKDQVLWLTWGGGTGSGQSGVSLNNGTKSKAIFQLANKQMCFECEVSIATTTTNNSIASYRPGNWTADILDDLYNIDGTGSNNQLINGIMTRNGTSNFSLICTAKLDGEPYKIKGIVMADAESMSADKEFLKAAAKGTWSIVEMVKNYTDNSGAYEVSKYINGSSNNEIAFTKGNNQGAGAVSFLSFNSDAYSNADHRVKIDFSIKGEGNTAIGIGLLVPNADGGDAPNTYGEVFHLIKNINLTPDGITEGRGVVNLNTQAYQSGRIVPPTDLFLGTTGPDAERTMFFSADAKGDEKDGDFSLEEDAWPADKKIIYDILPGSVIDVDIPYVSSEVAKIAGWIDFNRNGVFEPSERTMVATNPGSGTVRLSWTVPADFVKGKTFVRLRMSTLEDDIILPTGVAIDGEVEDHEIIIDDPKFKISKSSNAVNNIWNSTTSDKKYFLNITNIATVAS